MSTGHARGRVSPDLGAAALIASLLLFACSISTLAQSRVSQKWVARVDLSTGSSYPVNAITSDSAGNVYVAGAVCAASSSPGVCSSTELQIEKYSSTGQRLWGGSLQSPGNIAQATAIKTDSAGNVYVAGQAQGQNTGVLVDLIAIKYNANGARQWVAYYPGLGGALNSPPPLDPASIAVDSSGNCYITGLVPQSQAYNAVTFIYGHSGTLIWAKTLSPAIPYALGLDTKADAFVVGTDGRNAFTTKYDADGNVLWTKLFGNGSGSRVNTAITIDSNGDAFVAGQDRSNYSAYVLKYLPDGAESFEGSHVTSSSVGNFPVAIGIDSEGNSYTTGWSAPNPGGLPSTSNFDTLKFDEIGNFVWERT